jgi:iron(III) transport system permease protein
VYHCSGEWCVFTLALTAAGRGPGAALGIIAVLIVGIATYISHRVIVNIEKKRTAGGVVVAEGTGAAI